MQLDLSAGRAPVLSAQPHEAKGRVPKRGRGSFRGRLPFSDRMGHT